MNQKKLTREDWIRELEELCLILAAEGKEYAHVHADMMSETDKFLAGDNNHIPSSIENPEFTGEKKYKEMSHPASDMFLGIKIGDTLCVLATEEATPEKLRSRLGLAANMFNEIYNVNHIYSSHKDDYGVKFTRVG